MYIQSCTCASYTYTQMSTPGSSGTPVPRSVKMTSHSQRAPRSVIVIYSPAYTKQSAVTSRAATKVSYFNFNVYNCVRQYS